MDVRAIRRNATGSRHRTVFLDWLAAAILTLLATHCAAEPLLGAGFLSAGLSNALRAPAPLSGSLPTHAPTTANFAAVVEPSAPPVLWSIELSTGGPPSRYRPSVVFSNDGGRPLTVELTPTDDGSGVARLRLVVPGDLPANSPAQLALTLASVATTTPLALGDYPAASANGAGNSPRLTLDYQVAACAAAARSFTLDALEIHEGQLGKLVARFRCGADLHGVVRYDNTALTGGEFTLVSGQAWQDDDADGQRVAGEAPLPGLRLWLRAGGHCCVSATTTDADGRFVFVVPRGKYQLESRVPAGLSFHPTVLFTPTDEGGRRLLSSEFGPGEPDLVSFPSGAGARTAPFQLGVSTPGGRPMLPLSSLRLAPLHAGDRARYDVEAGPRKGLGVDTVEPVPAIAEGSLVFKVTTRGGDALQISNDRFGLRVHGASLAVKRGSPQALTFVPPLVVLPGMVTDAGHSVSGRALLDTGSGSRVLTYRYSASVSAAPSGSPPRLGDVQGPHGAAPGILVSSTLSFAGDLAGATLAATTRALDEYQVDEGLVASRLDGLPLRHRLADRRHGAGGSVDGDLRSDVLAWRRASGEVWLWHMSGVGRPVRERLAPLGLDVARVAKGDLDGDGRVELIGQAPESGLVSLLTPDQTALPLGFAPRGALLLGAVEFAREGRASLLFRYRPTGALMRWRLRDDGSIEALALSGRATKLAAGWSLRGSVDLDGDGHEDLLWSAARGTRAWQWSLREGRVQSQTPRATAPPWRLAAVDDFDGDGRAEVLWANAGTRRARRQAVDARRVLGEDELVRRAPARALVADSGDFDGDGAADLLWCQPAPGACEVWLQTGAGTRARAGIGALPGGFEIVP